MYGGNNEIVTFWMNIKKSKDISELVGLVTSLVSLNNHSSFSPISNPCGANCLTLQSNH